MAEDYFPFDAGAGADVREDRWGEMAQFWLPDGVHWSSGNKLQVYADSSGPQVKLKTGKAWVRGYHYSNTAEQTLAVAANATGSTRYDAVVLELDRTNNIIDAKVITGTSAAAGPTMVDSATITQIPLAIITVANGFATLAASTVADVRPVSTGLDKGSGSLVKLEDTGPLAAAGLGPDWQNIPSTFQALEVVYNARLNAGGTATATLSMILNNDTGNTYFSQSGFFSGSTPSANRAGPLAYGPVGDIPGSTAGAGVMGSGKIILPNYSNKAAYLKNWHAESGYDAGGATQAWGTVFGEWNNTAALINRLYLVSGALNFVAGSRFALFGRR